MRINARILKIKKIYLILFLLTLFAFATHKYYLSLTQIEYNNKTKSVEIIINIFIDDLEIALNKIHSKDFQLNTNKEFIDSDIYFKEYLQNNLKLKVNNNSVNYNYIGKEYDGNIVFFYLEIENIESVQSIEIKNTVLIKHFPKQQNLIKSKVNKKRRSVLLSKNNNKGLLKY